MRCGLNYSGQGFCPLNIEIAQFPGGFHLNLFWNDCLCMAIVVFKEDYLDFSLFFQNGGNVYRLVCSD